LMMNPVPWLQMTNMISYQGLVRTFPRFFQIVAFFKKHPKFDLSVYLGPISVPYMPQKNSPTDK
ncbi:hypothetical protein PNE60_24540, partial [Escherichia coli]|uniref:hypothetical protein n=1 Tax=Escherichia coli TaxID=562 RepID=UPI002A5B9348|nr:hypothetical protein [Escherichia coli]MDB8195940.1 hypothetical protein [Escherichia coli]MDB8200823.1 hypothetical protein [Escherichia coli]MDB8210602.1 hypothetical protein [Escherichia coli]MDB8254436.1 hypothetical protein [Escherichia coli]